MKTEILSQEHDIMKAQAVFTPEDVTRAIDDTYGKISKEANIKGFRKGKVPRRALELYFPKEDVRRQALADLAENGVNEMIEEYELKLFEYPLVEPREYKEGEDYILDVTFDVKPEIVLPALKDIEVERLKPKVDEEEIEARVKRMLKNAAKLVPAYEERPLAKGDGVSIKYDSVKIFDDGRPEEKTEENKKAEFLLDDSLRADLADALIGKKPGDKVSAITPLADDEKAKKEHIASVRHDMEVLGVMKEEIPELTDEFAKEYSGGDCKTVEELKESFRRQSVSFQESVNADAMKANIVDKLIAATDFEVPEKYIKRRTDIFSKQFFDGVKSSGRGDTLDEYLKSIGESREKFDEENRERAVKAIKRELILEAVADENEINVSENELNSAIVKFAYGAGIKPEQAREYIYSSEARFMNFAASVRENKALNFLAENVTVKEVDKPSPEEKSSGEAAVEADKTNETNGGAKTEAE